MLTQLKIKNLALIKDITLEFKQGFNLLLGETGAGKSIILDAVNFALGSKADKNLITFGEEIMKVEACFGDYGQAVSQKLLEMDIEDEGIIIITRSLTKDGKSDIKVNGNTMTLSMLKSLTILLADSYSQHENLLLLKEKNHLGILDSFIGDVLCKNKENLKSLLSKRQEIKQQVLSLGGDDQNRQRELEFIKYQIDEIENVNPTVTEENELQQKLSILASSEKITLALQQAYSNLNQNASALSQIKTAEKCLNNLSSYSNVYADLASRLNDVYYEVDDIAQTVKNEIDNAKYDEKELERVDSRIDKYKSLKKKYGITVDDVLSKYAELKSKYELILNADQELIRLNKQIKLLENQIETECEQISILRKQNADKLEQILKQEFCELGMKNAIFKVSFAKGEYSQTGYDDIQFMFSANLGEEVKPLSKIISGGEMSRFMLAFKNVNIKNCSTMIFDEIDTGISGDIGSAVAKKIASISKYNQVLCISHLPQVCVMADKYFYVSKSIIDNKTQTSVNVLQEDKIPYCIAKLTGGDEKVSDEALIHAKQLLNWANEYKKN